MRPSLRTTLALSIAFAFLAALPAGTALSPRPPVLLSPEHGSAHLTGSITFRWSVASDPDGTMVTYVVRGSREGTPYGQLCPSAGRTWATSCTVQLHDAGHYNAYVHALDAQGESSSSATVAFDLSTKPNVPSDPQPANGAKGVSRSPVLEWKGGDADGGRVLYSVRVSVNGGFWKIPCYHEATRCDLGGEGLEYGDSVRWLVTAHDDITPHSVMGPVWQFTVGPKCAVVIDLVVIQQRVTVPEDCVE